MYLSALLHKDPCSSNHHVSLQTNIFFQHCSWHLCHVIPCNCFQASNISQILSMRHCGASVEMAWC